MIDLRNLARPYVILEDRLNLEAPARVYRDPVGVVQCQDMVEVDDALARVEAATRAGYHAAGFMSFEAGYAFEPKLAGGRIDEDLPLLWFGLFETVQDIPATEMDAALAALGPPGPIRDFEATLDRERYRAVAGTLLRHIHAGDVYQVNFTFPVRFRYDGDPLALYAALRSRQPVAHGGVVALDGTTIVSVSPELFVETRGARATVRPMKGTARRHVDADEDARAAEALALDPKQRAENLMIVDLLRNDLARISVPGSVAVPDLFTVETYPTLHAMTSTVTATLQPGIGLASAMRALFPCGSVVGAPKHRASELIQTLETAPRGVYTGAIGTCSPGGDFAFNVAIRTAILDRNGRGRYGIGSGIVADSDPDAEYDECLLKARIMTDLAADYGLIETLLWSQATGLQRLDRHLGRLAASANALGFVFDLGQARARLVELAAGFDYPTAERRVRLELHHDGALDIAAPLLAAEPDQAFLVGIAAESVDGADPFLRHKTTLRDRYELPFADAAALGLDEVVFVNRHGLVTEAARNNVFVRIGERLVTPPLSAGLLPGVLRQSLLDDSATIEGDITLDDLRRHPWFVGNSLRGLRPASLADQD